MPFKESHRILNYRASSLENGLSPAEMLKEKKAKHRLEHSLTHNPKECQINAYNRTVVTLKPLVQEEIVRVRCDGQWGPPPKVNKVTAPRSDSRQMLRRNRRHLLKVPQKNMKIMDSNIREVTVQGQREQQEVKKTTQCDKTTRCDKATRCDKHKRGNGK